MAKRSSSGFVTLKQRERLRRAGLTDAPAPAKRRRTQFTLFGDQRRADAGVQLPLFGDQRRTSFNARKANANHLWEVIRALESRTGGTPVLADELMLESQLERSEFHRALNDLWDEDRITMHFHDHPSSMRDELRDAALRRGEHVYHAFNVRRAARAPAPATAIVRIVPASDRPGIEGRGFYVESPVGRMYRETLEMAEITAELQADAHHTTVDRSAIGERL